MARATRAESLTGAIRKVEIYSDFSTSFAKTPVGNQLSKVINEKSINQALKNLIFTNLGERPFQPYIGSNVYKMLFENNVAEELDKLEYYIENCINNNEKRVNILDVDVSTTESDYEIKITIVYNTINNSEPITFEYIFKRVR
jgi:phage baseplate assembly protein W